MVKEKRILSYFIGWLIIGFCILFVGVNNVFAEVIQPNEMKSQIRTIYTDGTTQWYTSGNNTYTTPLYFGTGPSYSTFGIPCNFRLNVIHNIESSYSYKYSYDMHIFTPYSTNNTWDSSKIDEQYLLTVDDDQEVVKESKCTVINTTKNTNSLGTFINKSISCVFTVNKNQSNAYVSAGYFCKGACKLANMEPLGFIPQESYMSIDNVKIERFNDNSNIIIDQNQTIIDQNNKTNEELGNIKDQIEESNKETQDVIKEQFNNCRDSYNLFNINNIKYKPTYNNVNPILSIVNSNNFTMQNTRTDDWNGIYIDNLDSTKTYTISFDISMLSGKSGSLIALNNNGNASSGRYTFNDNNSKYISKTFTGVTNIYILQSPSTTFKYEKVMINEGSSAKKYEPYGKKICSNKIDETNDKLDDLQGAITDSSSPNTGALENSAGWLPAGPLDSILNLPLTMLNSLTNSLGKTCTPLNLTLPYVNKNIKIPCLSTIFEKITGVNGLWTWVGTIASVLILYNYLLNLYAWVDRVLTLRAEFDEAMGADLANWGRL